MLLHYPKATVLQTSPLCMFIFSHPLTIHFSDTAACDITQLSAVCGDRVFNAYTVPRCAISRGASRVTGFTVRAGRLFYCGDPVKTVYHVDALTSFIKFLRSFRRPVLLVAHNAKRFDAPVLTRLLRELDLWHGFQQVVSGFVDSLLLSRNLYDLRRYSLPFLVDYFLEEDYDAHNATEDATMLEELFDVWRPKTWEVSEVTFPTEAF